MIYNYEINNLPNLGTWNENGELVSGIKYDILNSEMVNKNLLVCLWKEKTKLVKIEFLGELQLTDKIILDNIIGDYL